MDKKLNERQIMLIVETAITAVIFFFSLWAVYYEFGSGIFDKPAVIIVIIYLGFLGYVLFRMRWTEYRKKSTDEKIDELLEEIKQDRNERKQSE
ncbi:hypothetical protein ACFLUY_02580 [Chloroflexota bacterium]